MNCEIIKGKFGGDLLYVPSEQMLYTSSKDRNSYKEFVCYQTVLTDRKKKNSSNQIKCMSRVRLFPNGTCERINVCVPHTAHENHKILADDKRKMQRMKTTLHNLKENHPEDAHKIPNRHVFQREIST